MIPAELDKESTEKTVMESDIAAEITSGKTVVKVITVPGKLVNIVVK